MSSEEPRPEETPPKLPPEEPKRRTKGRGGARKGTSRRRRRRRKKSALRLTLGWLALRAYRFLGSLCLPWRIMKEVADDVPDYGGFIILLSAAIGIGVLAQYALYTLRIIVYDVDIKMQVPQPFPFQVSFIQELFSVGYLLLRNFLFCYVGAWLLKGERNATSLLMGLGYSLSPQVLGRTVQLILSATTFPQVQYNVPTDVALIAMTTSVQSILLYPMRLQALEAYNREIYKEWLKDPSLSAFSNFAQFITFWTTALACLLLYYLSKLPKKRAAIVAAFSIAFDAAWYLYGYLSPG
ncbi:hypothetical protein KEJ36_04500 [Candidatus Bathyarchaeota archaeon]|nr:hypothetical protein [Candidatus Bathyarchaeota archaeon]MBS7628052.1 hypothetical protein [Candidatus Bathyarchaeota archaeon]